MFLTWVAGPCSIIETFQSAHQLGPGTEPGLKPSSQVWDAKSGVLTTVPDAHLFVTFPFPFCQIEIKL